MILPFDISPCIFIFIRICICVVYSSVFNLYFFGSFCTAQLSSCGIVQPFIVFPLDFHLYLYLFPLFVFDIIFLSVFNLYFFGHIWHFSTVQLPAMDMIQRFKISLPWKIVFVIVFVFSFVSIFIFVFDIICTFWLDTILLHQGTPLLEIVFVQIYTGLFKS